MTGRKLKRPRDTNELAKLIVDIAIGECEGAPAEQSEMERLGRAGGLKGGQARARALTPEQRREIAQRAAAARWKK